MREGAYAQALAAKEAGDWPKAYRLAVRAHDENPDEHPAAGHASLLAGVAAYEMGRADEAVRCYRAAATSFHAAGNTERLAAARFNEGLALFRASRLVEAIAAYEAALGLFEAMGHERHRATCLMNLGNACRHAGKMAEALALYQQARSAFQAVGDEDRLGRCFLNAGNVLADLGRLRESASMFERARETFNRIGVAQHEAGAIVNLADLALRDGRHEEALDLIRSARGHFETARMQRFLVECDFLEGKATNSLELVRRAVDGYESFGDRRQAAAARVVAADLLNDAASSLDDLRQAAEQLIGFREEFHDPSSAAQASKPLAEVGGRLVHALCTLGDVAGAWEWLQKLRERRPSAPADRTDSERSRELRAEIEAIGRDLAAATDGHDALRRRQEVALAELSAGEFRSSSTAGSVEWCEIPDLTQARSSIEPNVVLVEAVVSPTAIHMIAVSNDELRHRQLDAPQEDVADAVAACRQAISGPGGRWVAHPLLEPLAKHLRELSNGFELLVWCPDGALEGVPIGPWLLEGETAWMQSGSSCYWLSTVPTAAGRPLVAGISEHSSSLGHLPEARREAELVAGILGDCRLLLDEEATVANVRAGSTVARILHVATHAVANESVPLFSRLEMASGPLYGRDLLDWGLASELVFLSACSTAEGQRSASGSSLGLAWAMLAGGARTVVASSWPVHDHAAQIWVERFYQSYVVNGNAAQAHQAACRYLASESPYDAPHYWATWKVLGSR